MRIIFDKFPLPPTENHAYPTGKHGKRFKGKALRQFEKAAEHWRLEHMELVRRATVFIRNACPNPEDHVVVDCYLGFHRDSLIWPVKGTRRKNDAQNRVKALFDVLGKLVQKDDSQMFPGRIEPVIVLPSTPQCSLIVMTTARLRRMTQARECILSDSCSTPASQDKASKSETSSSSSTKSEAIASESQSTPPKKPKFTEPKSACGSHNIRMHSVSLVHDTSSGSLRPRCFDADGNIPPYPKTTKKQEKK